MINAETNRNIIYTIQSSSSFGFLTYEKSAVTDSLFSIIENSTFPNYNNKKYITVIDNCEIIQGLKIKCQ